MSRNEYKEKKEDEDQRWKEREENRTEKRRNNCWIHKQVYHRYIALNA